MAKMMNEPIETPVGIVPEGAAHVWRIALSDARAADAHVLSWLSSEERERLERHRSARAGERFALTRLALRHILARYTGAAPGAVGLVVDPRGQPELRATGGIRVN